MNAMRDFFQSLPPWVFIAIIAHVGVLGGVHQKTVTYDVSGAADPAEAALAKVPSGSTVAIGPIIAEEMNPEQEKVVLATVTYEYPVQVAKLDIGALFIIAILSLAVY